MKTPRIANAIGQMDDDLVISAAKRETKNKKYWLKWSSLAACFAVFVIAGAAILPSLLGEDAAPGGRYKNYSIDVSNSAIVWPWEYQTIYEKYTNVEIDGIEYHGKGRAVPEALVDEKIGNYVAVGYDEANNGEKYTAEFGAYTLKDIAQSQFIAVKMENSYYVFQREEYAPPSTLGELMETVNLSKVVELSRFSEKEDTPTSNHFVLNNDDYIWQVLTDCKSTAFVEDESWRGSDREYLSFTITSDSLGAYKAALYVTEDGYLWTNAFEWQYLFNIGEEAAGKIIRYAKENSIATEYEVYRNSVVGTIVEITEEYILVDDSILCKNPADGITYKFLLNDLRISRYVDCGIVKVGDTVQIFYEGEMDGTNDHTITSAIAASRATISNGDGSIPE